MAHGLAVENWKWYVKSEDTRASVSGPYATEEAANIAMAKLVNRFSKLYTDEVNIAALAVHPRMLPQDIVGGKRVPARKR